MNSRCQISSSAGAIRTGVAARMLGRLWLDPLLVDERDAVPHAVDQIDEVLPRRRLGEPVGILEPRDEPGVAQRARRRHDGLAGSKNRSRSLVLR